MIHPFIDVVFHGKRLTPTSYGKVFKKKRQILYGDTLSIDVVVSSEDENVSIPKAIIKKLHIAPGTKFAVLVEGDTLVFKKIQTPSEKEFEELVDKGTEIAERNKIKEEDTEDTVHKHRGVNVV